MFATVMGWVCVACFGLAYMLEPTAPKKDGRFKTGYKNNQKMPVKSEEAEKSQKYLLIFGAVSGAIWYLAK